MFNNFSCKCTSIYWCLLIQVLDLLVGREPVIKRTHTRLAQATMALGTRGMVWHGQRFKRHQHKHVIKIFIERGNSLSTIPVDENDTNSATLCERALSFWDYMMIGIGNNFNTTQYWKATWKGSFTAGLHCDKNWQQF